jgi:hypothetical protein
MRGGRKKALNGVDKYSTGFPGISSKQITITITTSDQQQQINLHTISTLHNLPHNHTSQSWATEQKQPRSASATPKMPAASQNLSSNRYVSLSLSLSLSPAFAFAKNALRLPPLPSGGK